MQMVGKVQSDITKLRAAISLRAWHERDRVPRKSKKDHHKDGLFIGAPAGTRIPDPLIKSQAPSNCPFRSYPHLV